MKNALRFFLFLSALFVITITIRAQNNKAVNFVPVYAGFPYSMNFESLWIDGNDTADIPSVNWLNTPASGDNSWRRDDDTTQFTFVGGNYTPAGAAGSSHSARFHSWSSGLGTSGTLDFYIDLSPAGTKVLTFYYINPTGNDTLKIYLSTDGGSTFTLNTYFLTSASWSMKVVNLGSINSPTTVIRFQGIAHFVNDDIGIDQVTINGPYPDVSVTQLLNPVAGCGHAADSVKITAANNGPTTESNIPVSYTIDGNSFIDSIPGPLAPGNTVDFTFSQPANLSLPGNHHCVFTTGLPADCNHGNDTLIADVITMGEVNTFPFIENFENGTMYFTLQAGAQAGIAIQQGIGNNGSHGLRLTGKVAGSWPAGSSGTTTAADAWNTYTDHHSDAFTCNVDATLLSNPELLFDLRQTYSSGQKYSWFRVLINDTVQLSSTTGISDFNAATNVNDPFKTVKFNLLPFAGQNFKLTLQSSCKYDSTNNGTGDNSFIDNLIIRERPMDDITAVSWISPLGGNCGMTNDTIVALFSNNGISPEFNIPVLYSIDNGINWISDTIHDTLQSGDTLQFAFGAPANFSAPGFYNCIVRAALAGDEDHVNDTVFYNLFSVPSVSTFPYAENFESAFTGWSSGSISGGDIWVLGTPIKTQLNSAHSGMNAWVTGLTGNYPVNRICYVVSPCFDFSSLSDPHLSVWLNINTEPGWDAMVMETSVNDSAWVQFAGDTVFYNNNEVLGNVVPPKWSSSNGGWKQYFTSLTGLAGAGKVRIRFRFEADVTVNNEGIAMDDLFISDPLQANAALMGLVSPQNGCEAGTDSVKVVVENFGVSAMSNIPVSYTIDGGPGINDTIASPILPGDTLLFTFSAPAGPLLTGPHNIMVSVNHPADPDHSNDSIQFSFYKLEYVPGIPFYENYDAGNDHFELVTNVNSELFLENNVGVNSSYALHFSGGRAGSWPSGSSGNTTPIEAWGTYTDHHAEATTCNITVGTIHRLFLKLDLRQTFSTGPMYSYFRVMLNDMIQLMDTSGGSNYNPATESSDPFTTLVFELTPYATSPFSISLQAANKYNAANAQNGIGDNAYVDNIVIFDTTLSQGISENEIPFPTCYPNPASGKVYVNFNTLLHNGELALYDAGGKIVLQREINESRDAEIDLSGYETGLYCLVISSSNSVAKVKLIRQ